MNGQWWDIPTNTKKKNRLIEAKKEKQLTLGCSNDFEVLRNEDGSGTFEKPGWSVGMLEIWIRELETLR